MAGGNSYAQFLDILCYASLEPKKVGDSTRLPPAFGQVSSLCHGPVSPNIYVYVYTFYIQCLNPKPARAEGLVGLMAWLGFRV